MSPSPGSMDASVSLFPFSERCLLLRFSDLPLEAAHREVIGLYRKLLEQPFEGFEEAVPAYDSLAILYDPTRGSDIEAAVRRLLAETKSAAPPPGRLHEIPVHYGGTDGPDLPAVARENGITEQELVSLHTGRDYEVCLIGFTGGFPYLGFTEERLHTARKDAPDPRVPAGSVALAGNQTGIYPRESPGAWKIIGRTDLGIFDPDAPEPALFQPGDRIRFVEV